ncbi:aspartate carbamoyltransferase catalytic subunit [Legionella sp. km772]|uniref:aspartate carbamoyltransferase catalytic subunit n=1 Tax=Legionella sp. km772 TaxID=2498111 RepID=UPI000F8ECD15|nr:aspartate carbamoyltransferase catalytic subunit [Legionella sp. km772]RUR12340.1 aspartate carbamoyltransferase catalytic subunit [Legionella sp. km772]
MKHFLEISQLTTEDVLRLIHRALEFKKSPQYPSYHQHSVANLFYENSTRTRVSFELAAKHLGMKVINIDLHSSSETKGEIIEDTLHTLAAMGIGNFVIRHKQEGMQQVLADRVKNVHIVNAGDGTHAHPSQALLDMMTIMEEKQEPSALKIAILGNIRHSRVAHSFQCIAKHLNVGELVMVAPSIWQPHKLHYGRVTSDIKEGLADADVVMCLRVQKERLLEHEFLDLAAYRQDFALTQKTLAYAKPDVMVMHPGPMNRGIEIDNHVADGDKSYILQQVTNGVYARMAILEALVCE